MPAAGRRRWRGSRASRRASSRGKLLSEEFANLGGLDVAGDESFADAPHQDEGEPAALHFLVLRNEVHDRIELKTLAGHIVNVGGQADRRKVANRALGLRLRD